MPCAATTAADAQKKVLKAAEQRRPDVADRRVRWRVSIRSGSFLSTKRGSKRTGPARVVARSAARGCSATFPTVTGRTTTFLAGLRTSGLTAPLVVDGAINGELFRGYVERQLAPTLKPNDVVVMDNLNAHKVAGVAAAIERGGTEVLYLPPYSPDFNPIEQVFAKFKWLVRSAAERSVAGLWKRYGEPLERFTQTECRNYFRHCGYRYF